MLSYNTMKMNAANKAGSFTARKFAFYALIVVIFSLALSLGLGESKATESRRRLAKLNSVDAEAKWNSLKKMGRYLTTNKDPSTRNEDSELSFVFQSVKARSKLTSVAKYAPLATAALHPAATLAAGLSLIQVHKASNRHDPIRYTFRECSVESIVYVQMQKLTLKRDDRKGEYYLERKGGSMYAILKRIEQPKKSESFDEKYGHKVKFVLEGLTGKVCNRWIYYNDIRTQRIEDEFHNDTQVLSRTPFNDFLQAIWNFKCFNAKAGVTTTLEIQDPRYMKPKYTTMCTIFSLGLNRLTSNPNASNLSFFFDEKAKQYRAKNSEMKKKGEMEFEDFERAYDLLITKEIQDLRKAENAREKEIAGPRADVPVMKIAKLSITNVN